MTILGIDFGTSNTVVCRQNPVTGQPETLTFGSLSRSYATAQGRVSVLPSLVFVKGVNTLVFGETVRAQRLALAQPERYFQGFKRDLAADFQSPPRFLDGQSYDAHRIAELFLAQVWQQVLAQGIQPSRVILTAPVGAFERYLDWLRDLAISLGMPQVQVVDESTAAALGYAVQRPGSLVLVIDFGGGTLDLSLVRTGATAGQAFVQAEVVAKSDAYVGGMDIDQWVLEAMLQKQGISLESVSLTGRQQLLEIAERIKIRLSTETIARETWLDDESFMSYELSFQQQELSDLLEARQLLEQLRQSIDEVMSMAMRKGITRSEIERVLLVGGSCQIPAVQQLVTTYFGRQKVGLDKPFEAISHGAVSLAQMGAVQDYLRHSYAIRLWNPQSRTHEFWILFEQGSPYPRERTEPVTLQAAQDGQREIRLDIGEVGRSAQAEVFFDRGGRMSSSQLWGQIDYRSLDSQHQQVCIAHLTPPGRMGQDRIQVRFAVNAQRTLTATVVDLLSGQELLRQSPVARLL